MELYILSSESIYRERYLAKHPPSILNILTSRRTLSALVNLYISSPQSLQFAYENYSDNFDKIEPASRHKKLRTIPSEKNPKQKIREHMIDLVMLTRARGESQINFPAITPAKRHRLHSSPLLPSGKA